MKIALVGYGQMGHMIEAAAVRRGHEIAATIDVAAADATHPEKEGGHVTCPGERTLATRAKSMKEGVVVDEQIWAQICSIAEGNPGVLLGR